MERAHSISSVSVLAEPAEYSSASFSSCWSAWWRAVSIASIVCRRRRIWDQHKRCEVGPVEEGALDDEEEPTTWCRHKVEIEHELYKLEFKALHDDSVITISDNDNDRTVAVPALGGLHSLLSSSLPSRGNAASVQHHCRRRRCSHQAGLAQLLHVEWPLGNEPV